MVRYNGDYLKLVIYLLAIKSEVSMCMDYSDPGIVNKNLYWRSVFGTGMYSVLCSESINKIIACVLVRSLTYLLASSLLIPGTIIVYCVPFISHVARFTFCTLILIFLVLILLSFCRLFLILLSVFRLLLILFSFCRLPNLSFDLHTDPCLFFFHFADCS